MVALSGLIWLSIRTGSGLCECDNEPSDSMKRGEILTSRGRVNFSRRTLLYGGRCAGSPTVSKEEETHFRRTDS
jgi:hypothetical protein